VFRNRSLSVLLACAFATLVGVLSAGGAFATVEDDIRARLQSPADVCVMGDACAAGLAMAASGSGEPLQPQEVYQTFCFACHGTGVNNAPVYANAEAWAPRIAKGVDALYESAVNGFNNGAMPAKGLCMACSADDIKATVDYLVEAVQ